MNQFYFVREQTNILLNILEKIKRGNQFKFKQIWID